MESDQFDQLSELFEMLRERSPAERERILQEREIAASLREQVERLLARHDQDSPLDADGPGAAVRAFTETVAEDDAETPEWIGPHRVVRRIGEGGMGVVYEIEQESPKRRAAAKVIKLGMDTKQFVKRFESERQTLAMMDHPSIARIHSAGTTKDGRPYFVMEYVDGEPLLEFCDNARLTTRERLSLFLRVCDAIQHAHQKGVIHRDIKPSNVLATERDGVVEVKVIDFGIAKVFAGEESLRTRITMHGQIIGTPMYMPPEQAEQRAEDIDTRSDIYSLGVLLYELLTGAPPFDESKLASSGFAEVLRIISTQQPERPSTRCSSDANSASRSSQRNATPGQLRSTLKGDLDWIVLKCLEKDQCRRYGSTSELVSDIRNYLGGRPVLAGPQSASYRLRKFVSRNKPQVAAGVAVLSVLVLGVIGTSAGLVWALDERERAEQASRDQATARLEAQESAEAAQREADTAESVVSFLLDDVLAAADPARTENHDLSVRDAVLAAAENVDGRFDDRPAVEARVRETIARTLTQLGAFAEAEPHLIREEEILAVLHGEAAESAVVVQQAVVTNLLQQNRFQEAITRGEKLLDLIDSSELSNDELRLAALGNLGVAHLQLGHYKEAAPILEQTLAAKRRVLGDTHQSTLTSIHNLSGLYGQLGEYERSLELAREAYEGRLEVLGPGDPRTFGSLNLVTWMLRTLERYDEFDDLMTHTIADAQRRLGPGHTTTIELTKTLALEKLQSGQFAAAEEIFRGVMQTQIDADPDLMNLSTLSTMLNLAKSVLAQGRAQESAEIHDSIMPKLRAVYPPDSRELATTLLSYGRALTAAGRYKDAEAALLESSSILRDNNLGRADARVGVAEQLVELYESWHRAEPNAGHDRSAEDWRQRAGVDPVPSS